MAFIFLGYVTVVGPAYEADAFVPLAPVMAWTLLVVGHVLHLVTRWMRRSGRLSALG